MRNYIKYPSLEWLVNTEFCVPQGPSFNSAPKISFLVGGSQIKLRAPRRSLRYSKGGQTHVPAWQDLMAEKYLGHFPYDVMANDCWGRVGLLSRMWAFYGPWASGCKGSLSFNITLIGRKKGHQFSGLSFLNPKAFEMVLVHYLNDFYGHNNWDGDLSHMPRHHGPVDWRSNKPFPVPNASFKVFRQGDSVKYRSRPDHLFVFPVSDEFFVEVCSVQNYLSHDKSGNIAFDVAPMQALQDDVFNSITLELGPETRARVDKVRAECGSLRMCKDFAPLKWPTNIYPPEPGTYPEEKQALGSGVQGD